MDRQKQHDHKPFFYRTGFVPLRMILVLLFIAVFLLNIFPAISSFADQKLRSRQDQDTTDSIPIYSYNIIKAYPHDPHAFTQGLIYHRGLLYESTGLYGKSSLRMVELETGNIIHRTDLPGIFFGEGITIYKNHVIQLTWRAGVGFIFNKDDLNFIGNFKYLFEGWGITHDGSRLIVSDGSSYLHFLDPLSYQETGRIEVHDANGPITDVNELEYVKGDILANVWKTHKIAIISPEKGKIKGWIDLKGILSRAGIKNRTGVLNGIAYDVENDRLFVTGKNWPKIFEIKPVLKDDDS